MEQGCGAARRAPSVAPGHRHAYVTRAAVCAADGGGGAGRAGPPYHKTSVAYAPTEIPPPVVEARAMNEAVSARNTIAVAHTRWFRVARSLACGLCGALPIFPVDKVTVPSWLHHFEPAVCVAPGGQPCPEGVAYGVGVGVGVGGANAPTGTTVIPQLLLH
jgi:hypothetical protein